jgi:hypothetical protein
VSLQKGAPSRHTSDHKAPHVSPDEIGLETQNRSEMKVKPKSGLYKYSAVGFYNSHLLLVLPPSQLCIWIKFLQF